MKKFIQITFGTFFILAFAFISLVMMSIVPPMTEKNCIEIKGVVLDIFEGGENDIVFALDGSNKIFYINRGLEQGLEINELQDQLIGKEITLQYPRYWAPLDPTSSTRHLSKVFVGDQILYSESGLTWC